MKILHLLPLLLLAANFSGKPMPAQSKTVISDVIEMRLQTFVESDEIIIWNGERKLNWDDFVCTPQKGTDAVASTSTSLGISYQVRNGKLSYDISCHFSKNKSWGLLKTEYILAHEQAHFDITELHARKMYEALYTYEFNAATFKKDMAAIYDRIVKEKEAMQEAYDGDTDHSRKKRIQYDWLEKIDGMLAETDFYASYP